MLSHRSEAPHQSVDWSRIDDVLLDMDGTLLDRHFDNFFSRKNCRGGMRRSMR
jgi:hypothetical protein